ncbi:hypothetical protein GeomeDRAFT_0222 [Geobacter metallireducens RCH3]|uniref:hypothetical protein n=1 Tax=Geobacter TaxID=28231 RepID=UPI00024A1481|nr:MULTISPECIES: hypothetical protein [Geobacter]EHP89424.1 hypothetical protein GeomeDRAFT_0222 [Geobacter metallireducens RCH3]MBT1076752.1 hypothetical protein [Geobacter grbiciae]
MKCPKCKATVGIHLAEFTLLTHSDACGIHCYICGYWQNAGLKRVKRRPAE